VSVVEIRTAVESDLPRLRAVFRDSSWSNEGNRELLVEHPEFLELSANAVREGRTRAAAINGNIVGFASLADATGRLELEDLFVDPAFMRQGVGRALIRDVAEQARRRGVRRVEVDANDHALRFYEEVGFVALERVALDHGTAMRMTLDVTPG
jgi:GNAT superfamily N-acetyltransferase